MKEIQLDESKFPVRKVQWFINQQKTIQGLYPKLTFEEVKELIASMTKVMMLAATLDSNYIGRDYWRSVIIQIGNIFINDTFGCYSNT
jgi:hypothetical protein